MEAMELKIDFDKVKNVDNIKCSLKTVMQEIDSRGAKNA
jgi:hypothetical protein